MSHSFYFFPTPSRPKALFTNHPAPFPKNRAGFFPGAIYLCSYWYMPKDLATRISYFYCASALSGAFSGLLAAGIAQMDGVAGLQGWRWIFLLEGIATVCLGVGCFFLLIDTPALSSRWLEPDEIRYLELSMFIKQGGAFSDESGGKMRDLVKVLKNWRVYVQAYFLICQSALSYGMCAFSLFDYSRIGIRESG